MKRALSSAPFEEGLVQLNRTTHWTDADNAVTWALKISCSDTIEVRPVEFRRWGGSRACEREMEKLARTGGTLLLVARAPHAGGFCLVTIQRKASTGVGSYDSRAVQESERGMRETAEASGIQVLDLTSAQGRVDGRPMLHVASRQKFPGGATLRFNSYDVDVGDATYVFTFNGTNADAADEVGRRTMATFRASTEDARFGKEIARLGALALCAMAAAVGLRYALRRRRPEKSAEST
jgi:hypothetical protein